MFTVPCIQSESNLLALSQAKKLFKTHDPDEEHKPRLPDSIAQPITNMPLSRMENNTFAKPSTTDSHDMGLRTVYSPDAQKKTPITPIDEGERILEKCLSNLPFQRACNDGQRRGSGQKRTVNISRNCRATEKQVQRNPRVSMRQIACDMEISDRLVRRIVTEALQVAKSLTSH
ncbi:hypothetical protein TNCV_4794311 [Trichonephila clavipes]|nr:hypothetical protein TNCV_4794311 [Trichonephila clavipes]